MHKNKIATLIITTLKGIMPPILSYTVLSCIASAALLLLKNPTTPIPIVSMGVLAISGLVGTLLFSTLAGRRGILGLMLPSIGIAVAYLIASIVITGNAPIGAHYINTLIFLSCALLGALAAQKPHKPKRRFR